MMPSVGQCETVQSKMAALPSTLEIFDKFKPQENGKDSDSEESFHLQLDDDDAENRSNSSSGRASTGNQEENEEDILNKFDTSFKSISPDFDVKNEEGLLNDSDSAVNGETENQFDSDMKDCTSKINSKIEIPESNCNSVLVEVNGKITKGKYEETWEEGEFRSVYELEVNDKAGNRQPTLELAEMLYTQSNILKEEDSNRAFPNSQSHASSENRFSKDTLRDSINSENIPKDQPETTPPVDHSDKNVAENALEENVEMKTECSEMEVDTSIARNDAMESADSATEAVLKEYCAESEKIQLKDAGSPKETEIETDASTNILAEASVDEPFDGEPTPSEESVKDQIDYEKAETHLIEPILESSDNLFEGTENSKTSSKDDHIVTSIPEEQKNAKCKKEEDQNPSLPSNDPSAVTHETNQPKCQNDQSDIQDNIEESNIKKKVCDEAVSTEQKIEVEDISNSSKKKGENSDTAMEESIEELKINCLDSDDSKSTDTQHSEILELPLETDELEKVDSIESKENVEICVEDIVDNQDYNTENNKKRTFAIIDVNEQIDSKNLLNEAAATVSPVAEECCKESHEGEENVALSVDTPEDVKETAVKIDQNAFESDSSVKKESKTEIKETNLNPESSKESESSSSKSGENKEEPREENENSCDNDDENLLDISIIRDADEDDACAMATAIADQDAQDNEKSDDEPTEFIEEQDNIAEEDIDDDRQDASPLVFEDDDTNMEIDQDLNDIQVVQENDNLLDTDSHDISSNEANLKDQDTIEEAEDADNNDTITKDKVCDVSSKMSELGDEETNSNSAIEETLNEKIPEDEPLLIIDADDSQDTHQQNESINIEDESNDSSPQTNKTDSLEKTKEVGDTPSLTDGIDQTRQNVDVGVIDLENRRVSNKRNLSTEKDVENQASAQKKRKISECSSLDTTIQAAPTKVKTLGAFAKFMQSKKFTSKLSRSDLEQFCIQKICETFIAKSEEGELHHTIKKQEKLIEGLRKDLQQLGKQCKDLEIVNKKLMNELRNQNANKKPLVPLKITRSVGLQVRLTTNNEPNIVINNRKRPSTTPVVVSPQKQTPQRIQPVNNNRARIPNNTPTSPVVKQVSPAPSPQKSPLLTASPTVQTAPTAVNNILSQALQTGTTNTNRRTTASTVAKRTATPVRQTTVVEPAKPGNPGVIDLTDEDEKRPTTVSAGHIKILNKGPNGTSMGKTIPLNKVVGKPNQLKINGPNKILSKVTAGGATPTRVNIQPGVRLTPGSVINTSTAGGSPQMLYVLPTIGNGNGGQKIAFVNIPTSAASALNGNAVMSKPITLKTVGPVRKHPAPLPAPPRLAPDPLLRPVPPKPHLTIKKIDTGIILQWKMPYNLDLYEGIASYQLYAYQETNAPPNTDMWRKVGDVKALALPMACTLTQFADKNKYYFAVRSVDVHKRIGAFSDPEEISL